MTDPFDRFVEAVARLQRHVTTDDLPMTLATVDPDGRVSARVVLLRQVDARGFVFFTNYESRKALDLEARPACALCFHWDAIEEQVRVEGRAERVTPAESDAYFATRPRGSQVGAWASRQSRELDSRQSLERACADVEARYAGLSVPRPPFWGGYRVVPDRVEFWRAGDDRLHDRELYLRTVDGGWAMTRLYP